MLRPPENRPTTIRQNRRQYFDRFLQPLDGLRRPFVDAKKVREGDERKLKKA